MKVFAFLQIHYMLMDCFGKLFSLVLCAMIIPDIREGIQGFRVLLFFSFLKSANGIGGLDLLLGLCMSVAMKPLFSISPGSEEID